MKLSDEEQRGLSQVSFARMDGAWFMAVAKKFGIDAAWEMDVEAWKQFSYVMGKHIRKKHDTEPRWPSSFLSIMFLCYRLVLRLTRFRPFDVIFARFTPTSFRFWRRYMAPGIGLKDFRLKNMPR
ncbi:MAG TPA: DUF6125 family protein [Spirochaetota bacterium]|nr:DUF6125 family protein [Spirochaetota bacterium]HPV40426.1 DUF6125 family protein [Spirochaetota bacterium]